MLLGAKAMDFGFLEIAPGVPREEVPAGLFALVLNQSQGGMYI